ncbi:MAG: oxidoreductase [Burkholderiales bacterium]
MTSTIDTGRPRSTWLVTGCSAGLGRSLAARALAGGDRVAASARDPASLHELCAAYPSSARAIALDVTDAGGIERALAEATSAFGPIDVLVNNAGYAYFAPAEEGRDTEIRAMFEVNFFGLTALTRAVVASMRERRRGTIVNITSIAGLAASAGAAYYAASKFAVEGFTEALSLEVGPLGVRVIAVEMGQFRTRFVSSSVSEPDAWHPDYAPTVGVRRAAVRNRKGREPGDPDRAAEAIIAAARSAAPPARMILGAEAIASARRKVAALSAQVDATETIGRACDFPD